MGFNFRDYEGVLECIASEGYLEHYETIATLCGVSETLADPYASASVQMHSGRKCDLRPNFMDWCSFNTEIDVPLIFQIVGSGRGGVDVNCLRKILQSQSIRRAAIDQRDGFGRTIWHYAIAGNLDRPPAERAEILKVLLEAGVDANMFSRVNPKLYAPFGISSLTALTHLFEEYSNMNCTGPEILPSLVALLSGGADVNIRDDAVVDGRALPNPSPFQRFFQAALPNRVMLSALPALIQAGADIHAEYECLIEAPTPSNTPRGRENSQSTKASILVIALLAPRWKNRNEPSISMDVLKLLCMFGVDPNREDNGWRPLHRAVHIIDQQMIDELLTLGADPNLRSQGLTAQEFATATGKPFLTLQLRQQRQWPRIQSRR